MTNPYQQPYPQQTQAGYHAVAPEQAGFTGVSLNQRLAPADPAVFVSPAMPTQPYHAEISYNYRFNHPVYRAIMPYKKAIFIAGVVSLLLAVLMIILGLILMMTAPFSAQGFGPGHTIGVIFFIIGPFLLIGGCIGSNVGYQLMFYGQPTTHEVSINCSQPLAPVPPPSIASATAPPVEPPPPSYNDSVKPGVL